MKYIIYYKHTFACDTVIAKNERQARLKALKILKKEFTLKEKILMKFGVAVNNCGKREKIHSLKDLIEQVEIYEEEEE